MRGVGGNYLLADRHGVVGIATIRGVLRREGIVPTIGDHVRYSASGDPDVPYRIDVILPRRNLLPRPPISNLDLLFVTVSAAEPAPDLYLVDKLLILCGVHDIHPVVCVTKCDLDMTAANQIRMVYADAGFSVRTTGFNPTCSSFESGLKLTVIPSGLRDNPVLANRHCSTSWQTGICCRPVTSV
jgi:ribosome biogenesis GTPase